MRKQSGGSDSGNNAGNYPPESGTRTQDIKPQGQRPSPGMKPHEGHTKTQTNPLLPGIPLQKQRSKQSDHVAQNSLPTAPYPIWAQGPSRWHAPPALAKAFQKVHQNIKLILPQKCEIRNLCYTTAGKATNCGLSIPHCVPVQVPVVPLLIQFPKNIMYLEKQWRLGNVTCVQDLEGVSGLWHRPGQALVFRGHWGVNQQINPLSFLLSYNWLSNKCIFFKNI